MKRIKAKYLVITLVLVLSLALSGGCGLLPDIDIPQLPDIDIPQLPTPPAPKNATAPPDPGWSSPPPEHQSMILPSIADVIAKVKPSVVAITTEVTTLDFFNRPFTREGAGSGWIIDAAGYIVTNNHVIEGAESITVTLDDGRSVLAEVVGTDRLADLAVLKIDAENLVAATIGDSNSLRVGDWVVAIGNSLGQGIRATQGIISRKGVSVPVDRGQTLYGLLETDAAINPGNSGGPLVNMAGEVIGINSVKRVQVEVEGVGYAISSKEVIPIIEQLVNKGYVVRPWLGVGLLTVNNLVASTYNLAVEKGVLITEVVPGSPADEAGLETGDVISEFAGQEIIDVNELIRAIHAAPVGEAVEIIFHRGETRNTAYATLTESPSPQG